MQCPRCKQNMVIMYRPEADVSNGYEHVEVLGRCEDCDFDATWEIITNDNGEPIEFNLKQYFFG